VLRLSYRGHRIGMICIEGRGPDLVMDVCYDSQKIDYFLGRSTLLRVFPWLNVPEKHFDI